MLITDYNTTNVIFSLNRSTKKPTFLVMHKDIPLFEVDDKQGSILAYEENRNFFPFALREKKITYTDFYKWASNRTLSVARENAKAIMKSCDLSQTDRYETARSCRLLSVEDCFWIKEEDGEKWENFNLQKVPLSQSLAMIALNGEYITLQGVVMTPETSNTGSFPQCWERREDGHLYLLKKSKDNFESEREVLASDILDLVPIEHIRYRIDDTRGEHICICKCMTEEYSRVTYDEFLEYCSDKGISSIQYLDEQYPERLGQMFIADFILANVDRHRNNWGLYYDNSTGEIVNIHPLFDHNMSFSEKYNPESIFSFQLNKTNRELAELAQRELQIDLTPILHNEGLQERFTACNADYDAFIDRCEKMQELVLEKFQDIPDIADDF